MQEEEEGPNLLTMIALPRYRVISSALLFASLGLNDIESKSHSTIQRFNTDDPCSVGVKTECMLCWIFPFMETTLMPYRHIEMQ